MTDQPAPPTLDDVRAAATAIQPYLSLPTPLIASPGLSQRWNAEVSLKLELATPTGAFKVRGGIFLASRLSDEERAAGLVTSSTGNHGQSVAYGAAAFGAKAAIFMPAGANPDKAAAIERLGAEVHLTGERFDDSRLAAEEFAAERSATYVEPVNEPRLIAGVRNPAARRRTHPDPARRRHRRIRLDHRPRCPRPPGRNHRRPIRPIPRRPRCLPLRLE